MYSEPMQPLQPDQANFLLHGVYLPGLKNEHRLTKSVIEAIPLDQRRLSSGRNLEKRHGAGLAHRGRGDAIYGRRPGGRVRFQPQARPDSIRELAELAAWYADNFEPRFEKLTTLSNEQLLKIVDFRGMFQLPAVMYLDFVLHHSIHHRGQLSMYLRPMGAKVPSIYGESYDSAEARKAAQKTA